MEEEKVREGTLHSTWKQKAFGDRPEAFLIVIHVSFSGRSDIGKEFTGRKVTLLNLDGSLETKEIESEKFNQLVDKKALTPWKPKDNTFKY